LRLFNLLTKHRRPLRPGEQAFFVQRQRHRECMRLPWRAKDRAIVVARYAWNSFGGAPGGFDAPTEQAIQL